MPMTDHKIYEIRVYKCKPEEFQSYVKLVCSPDYDVRMQLSAPYGMWRSEIGNLNELFHIWTYDNLESRAVVRKNLNDNESWKALFPKLAAKWTAQTSHVARAVSRVSLESKFQNGAFFYLYTEDESCTSLSIDAKFQNCIALLGAFKVFLGGPCGARYFVLNARSLNDIEEFLEENQKDLSRHKIVATLLHALPVSPLR
ncbi:protein NipSnap homolog 3A-like [Convolutriloba macropyga]|uniref:protein NipSnap homolog 3A-like n=1 Tax=Convolutriloba macropyga TaxID=536237 RepID=UPI003F527D67